MEEIFYQKLKNINRDIFNNCETDSIILQVDSLLSYIRDNYKNFDYFKKFEELINSLADEHVLKNKCYTNHVLCKYLNLFFFEIKSDIYSSWGILLNKILSKKLNLFYPLIYSAIFKIYFDYFEMDVSIDELAFPLNSEISLFDVVNNISEKISLLVENSTSYDLLFYPLLRNKIVLYLYDLFKEKSKLRIWFCLSGLGIEPLLFSFILNLINEVETGEDKIKNLKIYSSDINVKFLTLGIESSYLNDFILKTKSDFAEENFIKEKDIKTSIKDAKKNIIPDETDFLQTGKIIQQDFDVVVINSLKYADIELFNKKIEKRFSQLAESGKDFSVIMQVKSRNKIDAEDFVITGIIPEKLSEEIFVEGESSDYFMGFMLYKISGKQEELAVKSEKFGLNYFLKNMKNMDKKNLKNSIHKIDKESIKTKKDRINYSYVLAEAGLYNKSFDVLKYDFSADYTLSYKILKHIVENCKNGKTVEKIENFIIEKEIKEHGFSQELLDAITDGINEFENDNKKSKWL